MEHGGEFERILDAHLAAAAAFQAPAGEGPVIDARPDPAIHFAMWGGGVPPVMSRFRAWQAARVHGVAPWVTGHAGPPFVVGSPGTLGSRPSNPAVIDAGSAAGSGQPPSVRPAPQVVPPPAGPKGRRRTRHLSADDRASLDLLRRSGAALLGDDFTIAELKIAYRRLAFQLHPDQHQAAGAEERRELGRRFSLVHAAYRRLAAR